MPVTTPELTIERELEQLEPPQPMDMFYRKELSVQKILHLSAHRRYASRLQKLYKMAYDDIGNGKLDTPAAAQIESFIESVESILAKIRAEYDRRITSGKWKLNLVVKPGHYFDALKDNVKEHQYTIYVRDFDYVDWLILVMQTGDPTWCFSPSTRDPIEYYLCCMTEVDRGDGIWTELPGRNVAERLVEIAPEALMIINEREARLNKIDTKLGAVGWY